MADFAPAPAPAPQQDLALPMAATPEAFGAGVAEAGEQAAASYQQRQLQANQIFLNNKYDADLTAGQQRLLMLQDQMAQVKTAAQTDGTVPFDQYQTHVLGSFDNLAGQVTDGVTNAKIARQLAAQVAEQRSQTLIGAGQFQAAQTAAIANDGVTQLANSYVGNARQYASIDQLQQGQMNFATAVHSLAGVTDSDRAALAEHGIASQATAYFQAKLYSADPQDVIAAKQAIDDGTASHVGVPGPALETLDRLAGVRMRAVAGQQQAAAGAQKAAFMVGADQITRTIDAGGSLPLEQVWQAEAQARTLAQAAAAAGKPDEALAAKADQLHLAGVKIDVNGQYGSMPPAQVAIAAQNAQAAIAAKQAAGQTVSLDEGAHATALAALSSRINGQLQNDPTQLAAAHGIALAPLDPGHPQSFANRTVQMQQLGLAIKSAVPLPPLSSDETQQFARQAATGDAGRLAVLGQLDHFDPVTRAQAARQIMPGDGTLVAEAQMDAGNRQTVQAGRDKLVANPGFWNTKPTGSASGPPPGQAAWTAASAQIDDALRLISPTDRAGIKQTAQNWLAGFYAAQGRADSTGITPQDTDTALRVALGGGYHTDPATGHRVATGGISHWGSSQNAYVVPEKMTGAQFQTGVYNQVQTDRAAGGGPVQADGKSPFDLKYATPVLTGGTSYMFRAGQNYVKAPNGRPYVLKLGQ